VPCITSVACILAASDSAQEKGAGRTKDALLVAAVRAAAAKGLRPDKVEAVVGQRATLNTFRKQDVDSFQSADIAPDPNRKPALPERKTLRWAAYWVRPVESRNPKVVGIAWPKKGAPRLFFGEVLPPG
jgi:hypothetical protein